MGSSFYKILLDASSPHLPLPPDFVSNHLENTGPVTLCARGGYSWGLWIEQIGDSYCFTDGWKNVVKDIQLEFADLLYFQHVDDQSTFKMSVYSPNGCEKILPPKVECDGGGDGGGSVDENVAEINQETLNTKQTRSDSSPSPACADLDHDDDDDDGGGGGGEDEEEDDPSFKLIISAKTHKCKLRLPPGFAELMGKDGDETMTLKTPDGKEWVLGLRMEKSRSKIRYHLSRGWCNFRRENDLSDGDECVFKFIWSEAKLLLANVTKKEVPVRGEVVKRKRGRPKKVMKAASS